jgi:hypothetical protein
MLVVEGGEAHGEWHLRSPESREEAMDLFVVAAIALIAYAVGLWVGRTERIQRPPWPEAEDCEPLPSLARRILPYLPNHDERR